MPKNVDNREPLCSQAFDWAKLPNDLEFACIRIVRGGITAKGLDVRIRCRAQGGTA